MSDIKFKLSEDVTDLKNTKVMLVTFLVSYTKKYKDCEDSNERKRIVMYLEVDNSYRGDYTEIVKEEINQEIKRASFTDYEINDVQKLYAETQEKKNPLSSLGGMSPRPGYYSGRGATISDMESKHLFHIHEKILQSHGTRAAKSFVKMVANLKVMSATSFLNNLIDLYSSDWENEEVPEDKGVSVSNEGEAIGTLFAGLSRSENRDDTLQIVSSFLRSNDETHITMKNSTNKERYYMERGFNYRW